VVYRPVPRSEILEALIHIRELHRRVKPSNEHDALVSDRREAIFKDLLSNLPRTSEHPTLKSVLEIADTCSMTLEGAHRSLGYDLEELQEYDLRLNGSRTHMQNLSLFLSWLKSSRYPGRMKRIQSNEPHLWRASERSPSGINATRTICTEMTMHRDQPVATSRKNSRLHACQSSPLEVCN
jgi:hypothetical protein